MRLIEVPKKSLPTATGRSPTMALKADGLSITSAGQSPLGTEGVVSPTSTPETAPALSIMIRSTDPADQPTIRPNYLSTETDRQTLISTVRFIRRIAEQPAMQQYIARESLPGAELQSDDEVLAAAKRAGSAVFHGSGTCKMGLDDLAVLDSRLRVRGVSGLRVADASVMPTLVSGNTNAAAMVIGWRASDIILEDA